jgi:hypothetical protein
VEGLIDYFRNYSSRKYVNSSLLLVVDNTIDSFQIKFTDFANYEPLAENEKADHNVLEGLTNLFNLLV